MNNNIEQTSSSFEVKNQLGLHARPASMLVEVASSFESEIFIDKEGEVVNGKSLMGLLMLSAGQGTMLNISVQGTDAEEALEAIRELFERNFDEE